MHSRILKYTIILHVLITCVCCTEFTLFNHIQGQYEEYIWALSLDENNSIYTGGRFNNTIELCGSTTSSSGEFNFFLATFDEDGSCQWEEMGLHNTFYSNCIDIENSNSAVYYLVETQEVLVLNDSTFISGSVLLKYSPSGDFLHANQVQFMSYKTKGFSIDLEGNVYVTGSFVGETYFDTTILNSNGAEDIFIAKYDNSLNLVWIQQVGSFDTGEELLKESGSDIVADSYGNVYLTGTISNPCIFGDSIEVNHDVYLAKYRSDGSIDWVRGFDTDAGGFEKISLDQNENPIITGHFLSSISNSDTTISILPAYAMFAAKFNSNGDFGWITTIIAENGPYTGSNKICDIEFKDDTLFFLGNFSHELIYNNTLYHPTEPNIFLFEYLDNGVFLDDNFYSSSLSITAHGLEIDNSGEFVIAGNFRGELNFGGVQISSSSGTDGFIVKSDNSLAVHQNHSESALKNNSIKIYPNPTNSYFTMSLEMNSSSELSITMYDIKGRQVANLHQKAMRRGIHTLTFSSESIASGLYFLVTKADDRKFINKLLIAK